MKVTVCTSLDTAVAWYRLKWPVEALRKADEGLSVDFIDQIPLRVVNGAVVGFGMPDCDVLVWQLPMAIWCPAAMLAFQSRGMKIVVELDDDFRRMPPQHASYWKVEPKHDPTRNWRCLVECCKLADLVTASTPALVERYAPPGKGVLLRNYVKRDWLDVPKHEGGRLTVGWSGALGVHPNDLQVTRGGAATAVDSSGARFVCIGGSTIEGRIRQLLGLREDPEQTGWVEYDLYSALMSRVDVGIVPLDDTDFNEAKSWLKGVEFAALGVPFVASDVREYRSLRSLGAGNLARPRARDWRREVKALLSDESLRQDQADQGRQLVRDALTIEDNAWRWAEAWSSVFDREEAVA